MKQLIASAGQLAEDLRELRFSPPVAHVYRTLDYTWEAHRKYLERFGGRPPAPSPELHRRQPANLLGVHFDAGVDGDRRGRPDFRSSYREKQRGKKAHGVMTSRCSIAWWRPCGYALR